MRHARLPRVGDLRFELLRVPTAPVDIGCREAVAVMQLALVRVLVDHTLRVGAAPA